MLCKPTYKILSVNPRSQCNLKKHVKSAHAPANETILNCIATGFKIARSKKKTGSNTNKDDGDENKYKKTLIDKTQLSLEGSLKMDPDFLK